MLSIRWFSLHVFPLDICDAQCTIFIENKNSFVCMYVCWVWTNESHEKMHRPKMSPNILLLLLPSRANAYTISNSIHNGIQWFFLRVKPRFTSVCVLSQRINFRTRFVYLNFLMLLLLLFFFSLSALNSLIEQLC